MPGPIDDTLKHLTELSPQDWVVRGGWAPAPASIIDADIATISGAADKVIRVTGSPDWLLSLDFQAGHDSLAKVADLLLYNSALHRRHRLLVRSLMVLLHPGADSPGLNGYYERGFANEPFDAAMHYRVLRVWQVPPHQWLSGGLGSVPLAPLGDVQPQQLAAVVAEIKQRMRGVALPSEAADLWSATYMLLGLRYPKDFVEALLQGVKAMEESVTYQHVIRKGETKEARKLLLLQGRHQFGAPPPAAVTALDAIADVHQLEELGLRLLEVDSWQELLHLPATSRRPRSRKKKS